MNLILSGGPKDSSFSNASSLLSDAEGVYTVDSGATINVETKQTLTRYERLRKNLMIGFLISIILMVVLSATGDWLPNDDAGVGRNLMLISEIPAFASSLFATRIFLKKRKH